MKNITTLLLAVIMFTATASIVSADTTQETINKDFSYGQTDDGYYYHGDSKNIVYSKDASLIGSTMRRSTLGSSQWYIRKMISRKQDKANNVYQNRINAMRILMAK